MYSSQASDLRPLLSSQRGGSEIEHHEQSQTSSANDQSSENSARRSHKWVSTIQFSSYSDFSTSSSSSSYYSHEKYSCQKNSSGDQDQYQRLSSHSSLYINTKDQQSWETDNLTPGELYTYHRNNAECECGTCVACQERDSYVDISNARIKAWAQKVSRYEDIREFDNDLDEERNRPGDYYDITEGYQDDEEQQHASSAPMERGKEDEEEDEEEYDRESRVDDDEQEVEQDEVDEDREDLEPSEASTSSTLPPLINDSEPLQAVLWLAHLPNGELFEVFEEMDGVRGFLTLNHGPFYLLPGQHIVDYVEAIERLSVFRFERNVVTWDGTANNGLIG